MYLDYVYLKAYQFNNDIHHIHDIFIYGYVLNAKLFNVAGFFNGLSNKYDIATFEEIERAYKSEDLISSEDAIEQGILLVKPLNLESYKLNFRKIINVLNDYLYAKTSFDGYRDAIYQQFKKDFIYGIGLYDLIKNHIFECVDNDERCDIRIFHTPTDNKKLLALMLNYLKDEGFSVPSDLKDELDTAISKAIVIRNKIIKYNLLINKKILIKIVDDLDELKEIETTVINQTIKLLQSFLNPIGV